MSIHDWMSRSDLTIVILRINIWCQILTENSICFSKVGAIQRLFLNLCSTCTNHVILIIYGPRPEQLYQKSIFSEFPQAYLTNLIYWSNLTIYRDLIQHVRQAINTIEVIVAASLLLAFNIGMRKACLFEAWDLFAGK